MEIKHTIWNEILKIRDEGFSEKGLIKLEEYGEQFIEHKIIYKRFSPQEQSGCSEGGITHVIATLLSGAEVAASGIDQESILDFKTELEFAKKQIEIIKSWAIKSGVWFDNIDEKLISSLGDKFAEGGEAEVYDNGISVIKTIGLDYFIQPIYALDRISLHNAWFPETKMQVIGFGENANREFKILVEQPYIQGIYVKQEEIDKFLFSLGFTLIDPKNWTYSTPDIYLSDVHDENVIKSINGTIFVIDCDIRLNAPFLKAKGTRKITTEIKQL